MGLALLGSILNKPWGQSRAPTGSCKPRTGFLISCLFVVSVSWRVEEREVEQRAAQGRLALLLLWAHPPRRPARGSGGAVGGCRRAGRELRVRCRAIGKLSIWGRDNEKFPRWPVPTSGCKSQVTIVQKAPAPQLRAPVQRKPTFGELAEK